MDRLEAMTILLRVADRGSFSAASRELGVPLATVSRKVSELEAHLDTKLLVRSTRKVALTDAGALYATAAHRILEDIDETERRATGEFRAPRGELVVTAPTLFGQLHVLPVVTEFLSDYPDINVHLVLSNQNLRILEDHIDVAVRIGALPDTRSVAIRIGAMRIVVAASPNLLAAHGAPSTPAELTALPCVNFEFLSPAATWPFRMQGSPSIADVPIAARLTVSTAEAAVWAAREGVGATRVLHYQCADAVRKGALTIILDAFELEPLPVHLLYAGGRALPSKTRAFLDFTAARLKERLKRL